jgi:mRNA interferase MazF
VPCRFLGRAGFVALDQLRTVDGERLGKKLGKLAPATIGEVHRVLQELFAE